MFMWSLVALVIPALMFCLPLTRDAKAVVATTFSEPAWNTESNSGSFCRAKWVYYETLVLLMHYQL